MTMLRSGKSRRNASSLVCCLNTGIGIYFVPSINQQYEAAIERHLLKMLLAEMAKGIAPDEKCEKIFSRARPFPEREQNRNGKPAINDLACQLNKSG